MTIYTTAQVAALDQYQFGRETVRRRMAPFTCPNYRDGRHFGTGDAVGVLVPTTRGWICQCCDYREDWAHEFMSTMPAEG